MDLELSPSLEATLLTGDQGKETEMVSSYVDSHFHLDRLTKRLREGNWVELMGETLGDDPTDALR
jgi:hypothetical protein